MVNYDELKSELNDVIDKLIQLLIKTKVNKVSIKKSFSTILTLEVNTITLDELNDIINLTEKTLKDYPVSFRCIKSVNNQILIVFSIYSDVISYLTKYFNEITITYNKDSKRIFIKLYTDEVKEIDKINKLFKLFEDFSVESVNIVPSRDTIKVTMYLVVE